MLGRPISHDRPGNQRASRNCANGSSEVSCVARGELAGGDGFIEEGFVSGMQAPRILDRYAVEIRVAHVELKKRQPVRQFVWGFDLPCHFGCGGHERRHRRTMHGPYLGETGIDTVGRHFHKGEQQATFGPESLDERGGGEPRFAGDVRQRHTRRAETRDRALRGHQNVGVGNRAGARSHGLTHSE
jgi:hypothetical protein